jgi:ketosteroid isomerase-like protein
MSETSIERIREGFDLIRHAALTDDWEPALETFHPEVEWFPIDVFPDRQVVRGREEVKAHFKLMWQDFEEIEFEPEEIIDAGDETFVVCLYISARGKISEAAVENRVYQIVKYRDNMAVRLNYYATRDEALAAAGLSKQQ